MRYVALITLLLLAGCNDDEPNSSVGGPDAATTSPDATSFDGSSNADTTTSTTTDTSTTTATHTTVRIDDLTPTGQGLALDAVQNCNQVGMGCTGLEVVSSSDDLLDYTGVEDGPNSQDDTCSADTFTRLGGTGNWVILQRADGEAFDRASQINVWTGTSACPLIEMGDKAFKVTIGDVEVEDCLGTCTVSVP